MRNITQDSVKLCAIWCLQIRLFITLIFPLISSFFILQSFLFCNFFLLDLLLRLFGDDWFVIIGRVFDLTPRGGASFLAFDSLVLGPSLLNFEGQIILTCACAEWDGIFLNHLLLGCLFLHNLRSCFNFFSDFWGLLFLGLGFFSLNWSSGSLLSFLRGLSNMNWRACFLWSWCWLWRRGLLFFLWSWCLLCLIDPGFLRLSFQIPIKFVVSKIDINQI